MSNDHDPDSQEFIELLGDPGSTWELAPSIIYTCDIDNATISAHRFSPTFVSHNTKDIFGYDASEILGHADSWREHMHPDDRSRIFSSLDTLFAQAKLSLIYRLRDKRGAYHLVRDELALVPDQTGAPTQIVGAFRNITLRKKAMEELEKYYAQYRKLFENIVDIYYRTDLPDADGLHARRGDWQTGDGFLCRPRPERDLAHGIARKRKGQRFRD